MSPLLASYVDLINQYANEAYLMIKNINDITRNEAKDIITAQQAERQSQKN